MFLLYEHNFQLNVIRDLLHRPKSKFRPRRRLVTSVGIEKHQAHTRRPDTLHVRISAAQTPCVFAIGDVAETEGSKVGRAGAIQAAIAARNIIKLIRGKTHALEHYVPNQELEGAIKLTLGKVYLSDLSREWFPLTYSPELWRGAYYECKRKRAACANHEDERRYRDLLSMGPVRYEAQRERSALIASKVSVSFRRLHSSQS